MFLQFTIGKNKVLWIMMTMIMKLIGYRKYGQFNNYFMTIIINGNKKSFKNY